MPPLCLAAALGAAGTCPASTPEQMALKRSELEGKMAAARRATEDIARQEQQVVAQAAEFEKTAKKQAEAAERRKNQVGTSLELGRQQAARLRVDLAQQPAAFWLRQDLANLLAQLPGLERVYDEADRAQEAVRAEYRVRSQQLEIEPTGLSGRRQAEQRRLEGFQAELDELSGRSASGGRTTGGRSGRRTTCGGPSWPAGMPATGWPTRSGGGTRTTGPGPGRTRCRTPSTGSS